MEQGALYRYVRFVQCLNGKKGQKPTPLLEGVFQQEHSVILADGRPLPLRDLPNGLDHRVSYPPPVALAHCSPRRTARRRRSLHRDQESGKPRAGLLPTQAFCCCRALRGQPETSTTTTATPQRGHVSSPTCSRNNSGYSGRCHCNSHTDNRRSVLGHRTRDTPPTVVIHYR